MYIYSKNVFRIRNKYIINCRLIIKIGEFNLWYVDNLQKNIYTILEGGRITMNQVKIGRFIAECRKKKNLTQLQLAEKLNITDRAVSKWENGRSMPDSSIMLALCTELGISVNELLKGELIDMNELEKKTEELLLEIAKIEEEKNKKLLFSMYALGLVCVIFYLFIIFIAGLFIPEGPTQLVVILVASVVFFITAFLAVKLEAEAGYYKCKHCKHKFVPEYKKVLMAAHIGTTRHLRCPNCGKKSWCKKVMTK